MGVHKLCSSLIILGYLQSCTVLALWLTSRSLSLWVMLSHCATVKRSESDWTFTRVSSGLLVTRMKWIWSIFYSFVIRSICDLKKRHAWNSKNFWGSWAPRLDSPNFCWWFFCLFYWGHVWIRWWTNNQLQRDWTPVNVIARTCTSPRQLSSNFVVFLHFLGLGSIFKAEWPKPNTLGFFPLSNSPRRFLKITAVCPSQQNSHNAHAWA